LAPAYLTNERAIMSAEKNDMAPAVTNSGDVSPSTAAETDADPAAAAAEAEMMSAMGFSAFGATPRAHGQKRGRGNARPAPTPARPHVNAQGDEFTGGVYMGQGVVDATGCGRGGNPPGWGGQAKKKQKIKHKGFQPEKIGTGANASALGKNDKMAGFGVGGGVLAGNVDEKAAGTALDGTALSRIKPGSEELEVAGATGDHSERQGHAKVKKTVTFAGTTTSAEITSAETASATTISTATSSAATTSEEKGLEQKLEGTRMSSDSTGDINKMEKKTGTTFWSKHDIRSELMLPPPQHAAPTSTLPSTAGAMSTNMTENIPPYHEDEMEITYGDEEYAKLVAMNKEPYEAVGKGAGTQATKALNPAAPSYNNETADLHQRMRNMSNIGDAPTLLRRPVVPAPSSTMATDTQASSPLSPPHDLGGFYTPSNAGSTGTHATYGTYGSYGTYSSYDTPSTSGLGYSATPPASIAPTQDKGKGKEVDTDTVMRDTPSAFLPNTTASLPAKPPAKKIKVGVLEMTEEELEAYSNGVKNEDGSITYFRPSFIEDPWANARKKPVLYRSI
jgi:hypothetical protein